MRKFLSLAVAAAAVMAVTPAHAAGPEKISLEEANQGLERDHPDYIKCKTERAKGSLAKRIERCMTNREWEEARLKGRSGARSIVDSTRQGFMEGPEG